MTIFRCRTENNCLRDEGAKYSGEALKVNSALTCLLIFAGFSKIIRCGAAYNEIWDEGAKYLSEGLKKNSSLTQIDLSFFLHHIRIGIMITGKK